MEDIGPALYFVVCFVAVGYDHTKQAGQDLNPLPLPREGWVYRW